MRGRMDRGPVRAYIPGMAPAGAPGVSSQAVFERYRRRIYDHIRKMVGSRADAEDLTQETFLRAHTRLGSLKQPEALEAWLFRIATNVSRDFLRPSARRSEQRPSARRSGPAGEPEGAGPAGESEPAAEGPGPDQVVDHAGMSACGEELFRELPASYRKVLLLHDFYGLTSVEIGRLLRCTPGNVKIRLHRARARFKAALEAGCDLYRDERGVLLGGRKPRQG